MALCALLSTAVDAAPAQELVTPFYQGNEGGVVGVGSTVTIETCQSVRFDPWPGGIALQDHGLDCGDDLRVTGLEAGAFLYIRIPGTQTYASAPLMPEDLLQGSRLSLGGNAEFTDGRRGTLVHSRALETALIVPWLSFDQPLVLAEPSGGVLDTAVTSFTPTTADFDLDLFVVDSNASLVPLHVSDMTVDDIRWEGSQLQFSVTGLTTEFQSPAGSYSATFLFDQSGSIAGNDPQDLRIQAAKAFLGNLGAGDEVALLAFATSGNLPSHPVTIYRDANGSAFTRDPNGFDAHLTDLANLESGGTPLYDAIIEAVDFTVANANNSNQAIVVFTDGEDTASSSSIDDAVAKAVSHGISLHTVALAQGVDKDVLARLASETDGSFTQALEAAQLISYYGALGPYLSGSARYYRTNWRAVLQGGSATFDTGDTISANVVVRVAGGAPVNLPFRLELSTATGPSLTDAVSVSITTCTSSSTSSPFNVTVAGSVTANEDVSNVTVTAFVQPGSRQVGSSQVLGTITTNQSKGYSISGSVSGSTPMQCEVDVQGNRTATSAPFIHSSSREREKGSLSPY